MVRSCHRRVLTLTHRKAVRTDGQRISGNPALETQFQTDHAICMGERQKALLSGGAVGVGLVGAVVQGIDRSEKGDAVMAGCYAQRGYAIVTPGQAAAQAARFKEVAEAQ